jgi:hypothetical protein
MSLEKLHLDCASSAPSHHGSTQLWPLLHRKDYLQGSEIPAIISPSRLMPIISTSPEPMVTARLGQVVTLSPRRLAEQPLRSTMMSHSSLRLKLVTASVGGSSEPASESRPLRRPGVDGRDRARLRQTITGTVGGTVTVTSRSCQCLLLSCGSSLSHLSHRDSVSGLAET